MDKLIEKCLEREQIFKLEDGFTYFFPCQNGGGISSAELRVIANYLDEQDKEHQASIDKYFAEQEGKW